MSFDKEAYEKIRNSVDPLEDAACRAQDLYNKILIDGGVHHIDDQTLWNSGEITSTEEDSITVSWEVSWRYGGHDEGEYLIPLAALLDDTWEPEVTKLANQVLEKRRSKSKKETDFKDASERKQFEALKKKFD